MTITGFNLHKPNKILRLYWNILFKLGFSKCNPNKILKLYWKIKYFESPSKKRLKMKLTHEVRLNNVYKERRKLLNEIKQLKQEVDKFK